MILAISNSLKNGHVREDPTKITNLQEYYAHYKHFAIKQTQTVAISKERFLLWFETFSKQRTNKRFLLIGIYFRLIIP